MCFAKVILFCACKWLLELKIAPFWLKHNQVFLCQTGLGWMEFPNWCHNLGRCLSNSKYVLLTLCTIMCCRSGLLLLLCKLICLEGTVPLKSRFSPLALQLQLVFSFLGFLPLFLGASTCCSACSCGSLAASLTASLTCSSLKLWLWVVSWNNFSNVGHTFIGQFQCVFCWKSCGEGDPLETVWS